MTFAIKIRGVPTRIVAAEYHCEVHGRFELDVERTDSGDAPDIIDCPFPLTAWEEMDLLERCDHDPDFAAFIEASGWTIEKSRRVACGLPAIWCISAPLARVRKVEAVKGGWQKPERKTWTDTRDLGEGQALYDWKEDRAKIWEERRKEDVVRFAREHNERVRCDE